MTTEIITLPEHLVPEAISPYPHERFNAAWRLVAAGGCDDQQIIQNLTGVSRTHARKAMNHWADLGRPTGAATLPWNVVRKMTADDFVPVPEPVPEPLQECNPYEFYTVGAVLQALLEHEGAESFSPGLRQRAEQIADVI